jgi:hypothetical protein
MAASQMPRTIKNVDYDQEHLAPVISLERYRQARRLTSREQAVRIATYPSWPGNEFADDVMDLWITSTITASDEEFCELAGIDRDVLNFILDRQWTWWDTVEVDLDENGRPRLRLVTDEESE